MSLSKRISCINPSPTLAITAKANKMKAEGINVIGFGAGEPDFDTPEHIKGAAKQAIDAGMTKYTPSSGTKAIKDAICRKLKADNGLDYEPADVLVSCGAKHSLFNAVMALCDEGDEVILTAPYWVSYIEMVRVAGGVPVVVGTEQENDFRITPEALKAAITPKTKLVILNSPSNPTGTVYTADELRALARVIVEAGIWCVSDEIYEKIIYDGASHVSIASFGDDIKSRTIVVNGVSKAYSMTGWRIGYAAGPREIIKGMSCLQDHSTSNPTSISQAAAVEAMEGSQDKLSEMVKAFAERRDYIVGRINAIPGMSCRTPGGAFYVFADVSGLIGKSYNGRHIADSMALAEILLEEAKVAVVPGVVFGDDRFVRLSYATSLLNITNGMNRIEGFAGKVQ